MTFDLYVWESPRDVDADAAAALVGDWQARGGDPRDSPFQPSTSVGWFVRELRGDAPGIEAVSDAVPTQTTRPIWLSTDDEPPARVAAMRLRPERLPEELEAILGLATKYDLVLYDARHGRVHLPLEELAAHASATFWPAGAIQAAVAGGLGGLLAVAAWLLGIPLLSGVGIVIGGFLVAMSVLTFVAEGRKVLRRRDRGAQPPV